MIMRSIVFVALSFFVATAVLGSTPEQRASLAGSWAGSSICTKVRPACNDEKALYHFANDGTDSDRVQVTASKIVDGKEDVMGTLQFEVNYKARTLSASNHGLWSFSWEGSRMTGTLKMMPSGDVVRNITLQKQ